MKRYIAFIILSSCLFYNGLAQSKSQKSNSPKEDIKVNREYDEQGNLIRFDSTYTYNWLGDTTLTFGNMPENFGSFFDDQFKFFNDSSFLGHSSFSNFDQLFSDPFSSNQDSVFMKNFGFDSFNLFDFKNDSSLGNFREFDELLGRQNWKNQDSISSKSNKNPNNTDHNSMDDMFRMMQEKMQKMEEFHRQFYRKKPD